MKKLFISFVIALISISAFAQSGTKAVGGHLVFAENNKNLGIGVKGQYSFTNHLRGQASFNYYLKSNDVTLWDLNLDAHYLFNVAKKVNVYPLAGVTYSHWSHDNLDLSDGNIGINLGGGAEFELNSKWNLGAELKFQIINNYNQLVLSLGVGYKL